MLLRLLPFPSFSVSCRHENSLHLSVNRPLKAWPQNCIKNFVLGFAWSGYCSSRTFDSKINSKKNSSWSPGLMQGKYSVTSFPLSSKHFTLMCFSGALLCFNFCTITGVIVSSLCLMVSSAFKRKIRFSMYG